MLRKLFFILLSCASLLPIHASDLATKVARVVAEQAVSTGKRPVLPWVSSLRLIQMQFRPVHFSYIPDDFPVSYESSLNYKEEQLYLRRMLQLQKAVSNNPELKNFSFLAPKAADLAKLSDERFALLENFFNASLEDQATSNVTHLQRVRPFTLAVQLGKGQTTLLEIWIDVPTKKIYLMSDNFYSTAATKYELHLF